MLKFFLKFGRNWKWIKRAIRAGTCTTSRTDKRGHTQAIAATTARSRTMENGGYYGDGYSGDGAYMEQEEEWEREGLLDPAWEKQQKKVSGVVGPELRLGWSTRRFWAKIHSGQKKMSQRSLYNVMPVGLHHGRGDNDHNNPPSIQAHTNAATQTGSVSLCACGSWFGCANNLIYLTNIKLCSRFFFLARARAFSPPVRRAWGLKISMPSAATDVWPRARACQASRREEL